MGSDRRRFFIPVPSLGVPDDWRVGKVVFRPPTEAQRVVAGLYLRGQATEILGEAANGCVAEDALDTLRGSLDALQLLQLARRMSQTTSFGLPGDIYESRIRYVRVSNGPGIGVGGTHRGDRPGWRFDVDSMNDWSRSAGFQFLDRSLQSGPVTEGTRRAVLGARLLVRAAREHQTDLKMLGVVSALEAWLLIRSRGTHSLLLAQRLA